MLHATAYAITAAGAVYLVRKLAYKITDVLAYIALKRAHVAVKQATAQMVDGDSKKPMFG